MAFLNDGRIEVDNNRAENAIYLIISETAKANEIDFHLYLKKTFIELPNTNFRNNPEVLNNFML